MAAPAPKKQEVDWGRQLNALQNKAQRKQPEPNLRMIGNRPENFSSENIQPAGGERPLVPYNQQNLQTLPSQLPGDAADTDDDYEEINDDDLEEFEEPDEAAMQRQLNLNRIKAGRTEDVSTDDSEDNESDSNGGMLQDMAKDYLKQAGGSDGVTKLLLRLDPKDDRNQKITGKIGFLIRVFVLASTGGGGNKVIDIADKYAAMIASGETQEQKEKDGEKKVDALMTVVLILSTVMMWIIMAMPYIILFGAVYSIAG